MSKAPWRCVGLAGWVLGHGFLSGYGTREHGFCLRCGMPVGGWDDCGRNALYRQYG